MRLFIAINFSDETCARLLALRDEFRMCSVRGNFSASESLYLTLAFIGEASPKKADKITAIMETVIFDPFEATIDRLGTFSRGTFWWAGLREDKPLMNLQREIEHKIALCGFGMDGRKYSPHITLGCEIIADISSWQIEPFGETIIGIDLMKSERISGKLTYTVIFSKI